MPSISGVRARQCIRSSSKSALGNIRAMAKAESNGNGESFACDRNFNERLFDTEIQVLAMEYTELKILSALNAGQNVGPESSMLKTRGTELQQRVTELALEVLLVLGSRYDQTPLAKGDNFSPLRSQALNGTAENYFNTRKVSIYAGSNEIQRNIMSKLVLGL